MSAEINFEVREATFCVCVSECAHTINDEVAVLNGRLEALQAVPCE